jgi:signal-transduction protein with cAMP-binding, CBS, and nucleotidyltransferase domain
MQQQTLLIDLIVKRGVNQLPEDYSKITVTEMMDKNVIILDESTNISDTAKIMESKGASSVLVKDSISGSIKGIVTERDILYRVVAKNVGTFKVNIGTILSSPVITIDKDTLAIEAIRLMRKQGIRRLPVLHEGTIVGIVTLMSMVGNTLNQKVELAELEIPKSASLKVGCPYCQSKFEDKIELSQHIDRIHLGSGLLEGDLRKWE